MTYTDFSTFKADYEKCLPNDILVKVKKMNVSPEVAWNLYVNTSRAHLGFQIFGRHIIEITDRVSLFMKTIKAGNTGQLPRPMVGISQLEIDNMGKTNDLEGGSALLIGRDKWCFTINDAWLLGGVHSLQEFYPASPVDDKNIFNRGYFLTITGRELFGLALAGYKQVYSGFASIGTTYVPGDKAKATALSLISYQAELAKLKSMNDAVQFFQKAGYTIPAAQ